MVNRQYLLVDRARFCGRKDAKMASIPVRKSGLNKTTPKKAAPAPKAKARAALKSVKANKLSEAEKPPYNEKTMQVIRDGLAGKNLLRSYATAEEMFDDFGD